MKKIIPFLSVFLVLLLLSACGGKQGKESQPGVTEEKTTEAESKTTGDAQANSTAAENDSSAAASPAFGSGSVKQPAPAGQSAAVPSPSSAPSGAASAAETTVRTTVPASPSQTAAPTSASSQTSAGAQIYEVTVQELSCQNGSNRIYGKLYLPQGKTGKLPVVILSHSNSMTCDSMNSYSRFFAQNGCAAYCFDFCGGSSKSRSDGDVKDMTVFTEKEDLHAVISFIQSQSFADTAHIFLFGTSQGGLVSALAANDRPNEIRGLMLLYPGFSMADQVTQFSQSGIRLPGSFGTMGDAFMQSLNGFDVYANIQNYTGDVIIFHGTADFVVPISYSRKAAQVYAHCELVEVSGASHGFNKENYVSYGDYDSQVLPKLKEFIQSHLA